MAFQPIVNITTREIFAHEALVRGLHNEPASHVFTFVNADNRYFFDQACRIKAIKLAAQLGMESALCINILPNAVYQPELCIRTTLQAAKTYDFPIDRIIFEFTESEKVDDVGHLQNIMRYYRQTGFRTAIDDFGAGYAGLHLLAELPTDLVKLDMALIRNVDRDTSRQAIVKGMVGVCQALSRRIIAEGVETVAELRVLSAFGIELFQGYHFAKPAFQALTHVPPEAFLQV